MNETNKPPLAIWFTGLSGSGKSTLACALKTAIEKRGKTVTLFDGDVIRKGLNHDLGFSIKDRSENIRRIAEVNKLFLDSGIATINAFISPTENIRSIARKIIGNERFFEIYLNTPLDVCKERDPKGWYRKIAAGEVKNFTGVDDVFEPSNTANLKFDTSKLSVGDCIKIILSEIDQFK